MRLSVYRQKKEQLIVTMLDSMITPFMVSSNSILIYGTYNYWMVALSVFVAILASFMGLQVARQSINSTSNTLKNIMLLIGSIALGGGIWTMHFVGMLAFNLCTTVGYDWTLTFLSLLPGIAASWVALNYINSHQEGIKPLFIGGLLVGLGIGTMHYSGMAAMKMAPLLRYDLWMFALSLVLAVSLAILSLWVRVGLISLWKEKTKEWQANLVTSVVMGCAIASMHYTGMAAARFVKPAGFEMSQQPPETSLYLALGVSGATILIILLVLGVNLIYRYKDISLRALKSERRLKATLDTAIDGIITINNLGEIVSINQATERLLGWSESELLGNNVKILVPEPHRSGHDGYIQRYLQTREARIIGEGREIKALHKNGDKIDIRLGIGHVKIAGKDFFVAFISDIRQRLKIESALRDNQERLHSLISNIPGIAFRCINKQPWNMIFISDAAETITGYPANDFKLPNPKRNFSELYHPDDLKKSDKAIVDQESYHLEYRIIRRDGEIRWLMEYGVGIKDEKTGEVWLDGFIMDITDRYKMMLQLRLAKNKAEQAAQARATFLANMSHEIRTPMNAIIGFSDILLEGKLANEQQRHLKTINQSAKSLLYLLNDVLDSAKLDKGKLELEVRDFSLIQEVDAVISTLWLGARQKNLSLSTNISPQLAERYSGSPERIRQVLTNLINNAIKFTPKGYVRISVRPLEDNHSHQQFIEFIIEDTGIGMSQAQLQSVFEPFTQADASMSRRFGGTGLGTSISKQLVELMGGEISATSELDAGSQFRFILPLAPAKDHVIEQKHPLKLPPLTFLIVDDIQQNIDLLSLLLSRDGHTLFTARDGQQALIRMATESTIDAVLMDIQMPVMDGLTASKNRRISEKNEGLKHIPIIALTASVLAEDKIAAQQAGMDGFANKPIDYDFLSHEIARVLNIPLSITKAQKVSSQKERLIDEHKGIALWGSKEEYYKQLNYFVQQQNDIFLQLSNDIKHEHWDALTNTVHKLKGICGNLSLTLLMNKLEEIESANLEKYAEKIESIQGVFSEVKEQVNKYINSKNDHPNKPYKNTNPSISIKDNAIILNELVELLGTLKKEANENEVDDQHLTQLLNITNTHFSIEINQVFQALNDFEFDQAQQLIDALLLMINNDKDKKTD